MISNPRHGSPPRLMAHQPTRCSTTQESSIRVHRPEPVSDIAGTPPVAASASLSRSLCLPGPPSTSSATRVQRPPLKQSPTARYTPCFQTGFSFDHLVGTGEEPVRNREAERRRGLQIDRKAEARRLLKRQVRRLRSCENAVNQGCHTLEALILIWPIGHQPTVTNEEIELVDGW